MNKFWANVELRNEENAGELIKAFFRDFNPESSITIKGKDAKLEIVFEQPPLKIIDVLSNCNVINLNYGRDLTDYREKETERYETHDQIDGVVAKGKDSMGTIHPVAQDGTVQPKTRKVVKANEPINIPELEEIAKKATSFEDFVKLVAQWLEMDKKQEFFENLIMASTEVDQVSWKELEEVLQIKGIIYTEYDKVFSSKKVSEKLWKRSVTIIPFLRTIRQYNKYPFRKTEEHFYGGNSFEQATIETTGTNLEKPNETPKPRVRMECMPEIRSFEEALASVDKTQPIEERVRYVLIQIGLNNTSITQQERIIKIASIAIRKEKIDIKAVLNKIGVSMEDATESRMIFSTLLNNFVIKYGADKKVTLSTFLSQLQRVIILESEIESS